MKKLLIIAALSAPLALGACSGNGLYGSGEDTASPSPSQTEQPAPPPPSNDDDQASPEPTLLVTASETAPPSNNPFGYKTAVHVTMKNVTGAGVDLASISFQGYDAEGNQHEALNLEDTQGMPLSSTLPDGKKVSGLVGFTDSFDPVEITVVDIMTNSNVTVKVAR